MKDPINLVMELKRKHSTIEIAKRLSKMVGSPVHRNQVNLWLNPDKNKRCEPRFKVGIALMMLAAQESQSFTVGPKGVTRDHY